MSSSGSPVLLIENSRNYIIEADKEMIHGKEGMYMTIDEARMIVRKYYDSFDKTDVDKVAYAEALELLANRTEDSDYLVDLGALYYADKKFDLALKYYDMAAKRNNRYALSDLGYIWYYGRTGTRDYARAFDCFSRARELGDDVARYKIADMYKNGYGVEKDYERYCSMITGMYTEIEKSGNVDLIPEIYTRMAKILSGRSEIKRVLELYERAREELSYRLQRDSFFGNYNSMKRMIEEIYRLREVNYNDIGLFDLYHILKGPAEVTFKFDGRSYRVIASKEENGSATVRFGDDCYRSVDEFMTDAKLDGYRIASLFDELYDFKVE